MKHRRHPAIKKGNEYIRKKTRVIILLLILFGSATVAYLAISIVGYVKKAYVYNPLYYEPRDLERGETEKEWQKGMFEKLFKQIEQEKLLRYLIYRDAKKTEDMTEQDKKRITGSMKKLAEEEKHKTIWEDQQRLERKRLGALRKEIEIEMEGKHKTVLEENKK